MYELAPSVLAADFSKLGEEISSVEKLGVKYIHLDVMDGHFVPSISFGAPVIKSLRNKSNCIFDVHLMIENPDKYIEVFANSGADIINVHVEACKDLQKTINLIKDTNKKPAVAIKPDTPISTVLDVIDQLDMVLIMSVEPGFGGQSLMAKTLKKSEELASFIYKNNLNINIQMDGGIYLSNVEQVLNSGVNIVVAGTQVFGADSRANVINEFNDIFANMNK